MPSRKEIDDIHRKIAELVKETGRTVLSEDTINEKSIWRLGLSHGPYRINIFHPLTQRWMDVLLYLKFGLSPTQRELLAGIYGNPSERFRVDHRLRSLLTCPYTFYQIKYDKNPDKPDIPSGVLVGNKIFPFEDSFSVCQLQNSIQSVINATALGASYLASMLQVGEISIQQQEAFSSTPNGMYR